MPEEQDDTILILGDTYEEKNSTVIDEINNLHEDGFKTVLEASCASYVIVTSVKALTYRVEVFEAQVLIDAIELECTDLREGSKGAAIFLKRYTSAHEKFKQKLCTRSQNKSAESIKDREKTKVENYQSSQQFIPPMHTATNKESKSTLLLPYRGGLSGLNGAWQKLRGYLSFIKDNQGLKLAIVLLGVVFTVLVLARVLMCQLDYFLEKEEKVSYYKQTESFCHKLEEGCLGLTQSKMVDEELFTPEYCQDYCNEGDIPLERCEEVLDYFKENKMFEKRKNMQQTFVPEKLVNKLEEKVDEKVVFLQAETFELMLGKIFHLSVKNAGLKACTVQVKNLSVNESEHDEIVQFIAGISKLNIAPEQTKKFGLFLEESYYRQFVKGKYTGKIDFSLFFENGKKETVSKSFFFEVK